MFKRVICCLGLALSLISTAHANIIPTLSNITGSGPYTWNYDVNLTLDQNAVSGSYFTIYDFNGVTGTGITAPTNWSWTIQNVGTTPSDVLPGDDPNIPNITFTYTGETLIGAQDLGIFSIESIYNQMGVDYFTGLAARNSGPLANTTISNIGQINVPQASPVVPEPATMVLMGTGLITMAGAAMRKRKRQLV